MGTPTRRVPGIPEQRAEPIGCQRSTHNYPALLASAQFEALRPDTDLVTITIGGNDIKSVASG